ncbi:MAG: AAA family ATPase [Rhodospirillales bacterium]|nr:AAA family ATPase [Rhodospirillales bacterium]
MKLRSLALNQLKKFTSPTRLDGIDDGLNVVVGPNEMGKSTLLDALRAALFEKHSSKAQPIAALQNDRSQAGPVVELGFELDDGLYRITKRFIKKPYARLSCPDGRRLEGDAAEDALRRLLGFDEPGKTGAKPETLGMWNVLWVQQGQSFGAPHLPETARSSLHSALESEVGDVLGGRRGRVLPQVFERQLGELVTSGGKPRGDYKARIDHVQTLKNELASLRTRRQELSQTLDRLEEAEATLSRLSSGDQDQRDRAELEGAHARRGQAAELEARIQGAASELKLKERTLERAEQARKDRIKLKEEIASDEQALAAANDRLAEVTSREKEARSRLDSLQAGVRAAESAVTTADAAVLRSRRILAAVEREARIRALQDQYEKAEDAEQHQHQARQDAAAILVTEKAIDPIRAAAKELETITGRLSAAATAIIFDMSPEALSGIEIDGKPPSPASPVLHAIEATRIAIPDRGRIIIDPAIKNRDKLLAQQRDANAKLKAALDAAGAASAEDAEQQYRRRQTLLDQAELARHEAALHAPATDDREAGARSLADYIEGLRQVLAREKDELCLQAPPARQEAEAALRAAEEHGQEARHALEIARAEFSGPEETLGPLQTELGAVNARYEDIGARLKKRREEYQKAEETHPDSGLQADIDAARSAVSLQERAVSGLEAERTDETLPQLDARIGRLGQAIHERREKRAKLKEEIAGLKSRVEVFEGAGLDEAIEQKGRELELCERESEDLEREVDVLTLLLDTLRAAERDAKERYLSPVLKRVQPYLQILFPGAQIIIDENLQIKGILREAGYEEIFDLLSMGTQEQIAVLVRLAFAKMLVEQGHPATVILDDALVFSDDRRMSRMFDILNMAARNIQLIILTCREQLFEGLGGRRLSLQPGSSEGLLSA